MAGFDFHHAALTFMLAGDATVTMRSQKTGAHFTYRLRRAREKPNEGPVWFASVLGASDDESVYAYFGLIKSDAAGDLFFVPARPEKARISADAPSSVAFAWAMNWMLNAGQLPPKTDVMHEGKCGRCGRKLTHPSSLTSGFGPECSSRVAEAA
jgi:hypothetical protein